MLSSHHNRPKNPKRHCAKGVHIIAVSGYGASSTGYGILDSRKARILKNIPHSTAVSVPYNKGELDHYQSAINGATSNVVRYINGCIESCPHGRVVLLGYSAGAMASMNAVCGGSEEGFSHTNPISGKHAENIIATIVYGDESHTAHQAYNTGTCKTNGPFIRHKPACGPFAKHIKSYCDTNDDRCCPPDRSGKDVHHMYSQMYDDAAMRYVMTRHRETRKHPRYRKAVQERVGGA